MPRGPSSSPESLSSSPESLPPYTERPDVRGSPSSNLLHRCSSKAESLPPHTERRRCKRIPVVEPLPSRLPEEPEPLFECREPLSAHRQTRCERFPRRQTSYTGAPSTPRAALRTPRDAIRDGLPDAKLLTPVLDERRERLFKSRQPLSPHAARRDARGFPSSNLLHRVLPSTPRASLRMPRAAIGDCTRSPPPATPPPPPASPRPFTRPDAPAGRRSAAFLAAVHQPLRRPARRGRSRRRPDPRRP